jgi:hypothetical protein
MLVLLAAIGIVGLLVARRYGVAHVLRTVNQALGIARAVHTPVSRTAYSQTASAQSPAQGDRLLKAGIKIHQSRYLTHWNDLPGPGP